MKTYRTTQFRDKVKESSRYKAEVLRQRLDIERSSFISTWQDLNDFICTRRARFFISDTNQGDLRSDKILDTTATEAADSLAAAMHGGITSPSRKWFKLAAQSSYLNDSPAVMAWLYNIEDIMNTVLIRSNFYQSCQTFYLDGAVFATSVMLVEENFEGKYIQTEVLPIGSYLISENANKKIDTLYREFTMTIRQLLEAFARFDEDQEIMNWENFSDHVKNAYENQDYEQRIEVVHLIAPNEDFNPRRQQLSKYKRYKSCYYERGMAGTNSYPLTGPDGDKYLSESGYNLFPAMVLRWRTTGEDSYGTDSPGWRSLPDIKQLQKGESFELQAIEKLAKPPLVASTAMRTAVVTQLPGDVTYDDNPNDTRVRAMFQVDPRIKELEYKQEQVRSRIKRAFKEDLFLALSTIEGPQRTATEVNEIKAEKTLVIGPVLEQLNTEYDNFIDILFAILLRNGLIPPPPPELQGQPLKVNYISVMHAAQKLVELNSVNAFTQYCISLGQTNPTYLDKFNGENSIDRVGQIVSLPPGMVRSDEEVAQIRAQRAKMQQAQMAMQAMETGSQSAKNLANSDTSGENALTALLNQ